jgi:hypothetical protein
VSGTQLYSWLFGGYVVQARLHFSSVDHHDMLTICSHSIRRLDLFSGWVVLT